MKKALPLVFTLFLAFGALAQEVPGYYDYTHSWKYAMGDDSIFCTEKGTMEFWADGTALDHAQQQRVLVRPDGTWVSWDFDYYSPSLWKVDGNDFYFSGDSLTFKMTLLSPDFAERNRQSMVTPEWYREYAQKIITSVHRSIGHNTKFNLDALTDCLLRWTYTYRDGHTDSWEFYRTNCQQNTETGR